MNPVDTADPATNEPSLSTNNGDRPTVEEAPGRIKLITKLLKNQLLLTVAKQKLRGLGHKQLLVVTITNPCY